jgi:hypothetical protein
MNQAINDYMLDSKSFPQPDIKVSDGGKKKAKKSLSGGSARKVKYGCRDYVMHEGPRGGLFIMVKGKKVYVKHA